MIDAADAITDIHSSFMKKVSSIYETWYLFKYAAMKPKDYEISKPTILSNLGAKPLLSSLPVDHIPDSTKVLHLTVLILQAIKLGKKKITISHHHLLQAYAASGEDVETGKYVLISMLPSINSQQRHLSANNRILVLYPEKKSQSVCRLSSIDLANPRC